MIEFINNIKWELIIAVMALVVSIITILTQRKHNRLSFKPIPVIIKYNYVNVLRVRLWNKGTGPLIIKSLKVKDKGSLIDLMPVEAKKLTFVEYIQNFTNRAISPNDTLNMIEFKKRKNQKGEILDKYENAFNKIKHTLNGLEIYIEYTDVYGTLMKYKSEVLDFGEAFDEEKPTS